VSIVTNRREADAAAEQLTTFPDEDLATGLVDWEVKSMDASLDLAELGVRLALVRDRKAEAEGWIRLYAAEIRSRRLESGQEGGER